MSARIPMAAAALAASLATAGAAQAAGEEIQVYMDEIGPPHRLGLDVHLNYVAEGRDTADYPGQQLSDGRTRVTPEWGYALNDQFELGLYLPLITLETGGTLRAGGIKGRLKWAAPHDRDRGWFFGGNFELGRVAHDLDQNPWNAELKGIAGVRTGRWTLAANLNIGWVVSGPDRGAVDFEIATKVAYRLDEKTQIGVESYNGLGGGGHFGELGRQDHVTYLAVDRSLGAWDLNLGVGRGYGAPEDQWVVKAVVGVPIS